MSVFIMLFFSTQVEFVFEKEGDPEESTWSSEYMLVNKLGLSMCQWSNTKDRPKQRNYTEFTRENNSIFIT